MKIAVSLLPSQPAVSADTEIAVVIDVLRATSVMTTALAAGAKRFVTCQSIDEARQLAAELDETPLLCGERNCQPIEGFDLGNSPAEYSPEVVQDRTLVLTTTNGTRAIEASQQAQKMIVASFLNLTATVQKIRHAQSAHLVCAGTNGQVTAEDVLLAGAICEQLSRVGPQEHASVDFVGDDPILARQLWIGWMGSAGELALSELALSELALSELALSGRQAALADRLSQSQGGRNLIALGYQADLQRCAQIDRYDIVPERISSHPATFGLPI